MQALYWNHVNQAATVYVAVVAALAAATAIVWEISKGQPWDSLTVLLIALAAFAASYIYYERGFRGYIALCTYSQAGFRARRYFWDRFAAARSYILMPVSDAWPITQPRRSGSAYWSLVLMNVLMAALIAGIGWLLTISIAPTISPGWLTAGSVLVFLLCTIVFITRLNKRIEVHSQQYVNNINFPLNERPSEG